MKYFNIDSGAMVVTSTYVTDEKLSILEVSHEADEEGGSLWQFHCGNGNYSMERMQLVRLDTILMIDPSVAEVADLVVGATATRVAIGLPWRVMPNCSTPDSEYPASKLDR